MAHYNMLLWSNETGETHKSQARQILDILNAFNEVEYLAPRFLTASAKNKAKLFECILENIQKMIEQRDKKDDLGVVMSFFFKR